MSALLFSNDIRPFIHSQTQKPKSIHDSATQEGENKQLAALADSYYYLILLCTTCGFSESIHCLI